MTVHRHAALAVALLSPAAALAHPGHEIQSFTQGVLHPFTGIDHLLAMLALGALAGRLGGRALWLVPASFLVLMMSGGVLGARGFALPFTEIGIALSLIAFGGAIALRRKLPLAATCALAGCFAVFHGLAHGAEMASDVSGLAYGAGFIASTGALHLIGLSFALLVLRADAVQTLSLLRCGGGAIASVGVLSVAALL
jgi:urease accessory protein